MQVGLENSLLPLERFRWNARGIRDVGQREKRIAPVRSRQNNGRSHGGAVWEAPWLGITEAIGLQRPRLLVPSFMTSAHELDSGAS